MSDRGSRGGYALSRDEVTRDDEARFWRLVEKTDGCWYWRTVGRGVYAQFRLIAARRYEKAHRVSVVLSGRSIEAGDVVLHECDEPSCVNPAHLRVGTQRENVRDCINKGRHQKQVA